MYNSKYLKVDNPSKKNLKNPSPQVSVPFESQEGFMNGLPPEGHHYRILGDTLFNPTPFPITAVANTGQVEKLLPFHTKPVNFNGADYVDEYLDDDQIAELQKGGYIIEEYQDGGGLMTGAGSGEGFFSKLFNKSGEGKGLFNFGKRNAKMPGGFDPNLRDAANLSTGYTFGEVPEGTMWGTDELGWEHSYRPDNIINPKPKKQFTGFGKLFGQQESNIQDCPEGYVKDMNGNCIPSVYSAQESNVRTAAPVRRSYTNYLKTFGSTNPAESTAEDITMPAAEPVEAPAEPTGTPKFARKGGYVIKEYDTGGEPEEEDPFTKYIREKEQYKKDLAAWEARKKKTEGSFEWVPKVNGIHGTKEYNDYLDIVNEIPSVTIDGQTFKLSDYMQRYDFGSSKRYGVVPSDELMKAVYNRAVDKYGSSAEKAWESTWEAYEQSKKSSANNNLGHVVAHRLIDDKYGVEEWKDFMDKTHPHDKDYYLNRLFFPPKVVKQHNVFDEPAPVEPIEPPPPTLEVRKPQTIEVPAPPRPIDNSVLQWNPGKKRLFRPDVQGYWTKELMEGAAPEVLAESRAREAKLEEAGRTYNPILKKFTKQLGGSQCLECGGSVRKYQDTGEVQYDPTEGLPTMARTAAWLNNPLYLDYLQTEALPVHQKNVEYGNKIMDFMNYMGDIYEKTKTSRNYDDPGVIGEFTKRGIKNLEDVGCSPTDSSCVASVAKSVYAANPDFGNLTRSRVSNDQVEQAINKGTLDETWPGFEVLYRGSDKEAAYQAAKDSPYATAFSVLSPSEKHMIATGKSPSGEAWGADSPGIERMIQSRPLSYYESWFGDQPDTKFNVLAYKPEKISQDVIDQGARDVTKWWDGVASLPTRPAKTLRTMADYVPEMSPTMIFQEGGYVDMELDEDDINFLNFIGVRTEDI